VSEAVSHQLLPTAALV
jgi:hypothetical protein